MPIEDNEDSTDTNAIRQATISLHPKVDVHIRASVPGRDM